MTPTMMRKEYLRTRSNGVRILFENPNVTGTNIECHQLLSGPFFRYFGITLKAAKRSFEGISMGNRPVKNGVDYYANKGWST
jgi:hypothetical protein